MFKKELLEKDCCVKCDSEKQAKNLLKWLHGKGYKWKSGDSLLQDRSCCRTLMYCYIWPAKKSVTWGWGFMSSDKFYTYTQVLQELKTDNTSIIDFMTSYLPDVKKIIYNNPATVLIFKDGSKSVVKREENQQHDLEKAMLFAWVKKYRKVKKLKNGTENATIGHTSNVIWY